MVALAGNWIRTSSIYDFDAASTSYRSVYAGGDPGSIFMVFQGGSAVDGLPTRWKAPFWPLVDTEYYGVNSAAIGFTTGMLAQLMPSSGESSQSMWIALQLVQLPPAVEKQSGFFSRARLIGRR